MTWTEKKPELQKQWPTRRGLPGYIIKMVRGNLCGYLALPKKHQFHGADYEQLNPHLQIHGGLTYAGPSQLKQLRLPDTPTHPDDDTWWLGFDCAQPGDYVPAIHDFTGEQEGRIYRDINYVTQEVESLAQQIYYLPTLYDHILKYLETNISYIARKHHEGIGIRNI